MNLRKPAFAAVALAALFAAGCEESDSSSTTRDRDRDGISDRYDRRPTSDDRLDDDVVIGRNRSDRDRDRRGLSEIPRDAVRVEQGTGKALRYEAERDGRVYVYDEDDDRVVYTGKLYRGEEFVADPDRDLLAVNGKRLDDVNLRSAHRYRVYFMRN